MTLNPPQVFNQRLQDEFGTAVLITSPTVPYKIVSKDGTDEKVRWSGAVLVPARTDPKDLILKIEYPVDLMCWGTGEENSNNTIDDRHNHKDIH
jgi:translation elongation factor EF-4